MIYFGSFFAGLINGLFASGAGQIYVFVLIFILKLDTHKSRATSIFVISIVTIITFIRYLNIVNVKLNEAVIVATVGAVFGIIGSKIMKKVPENYLNLLSGILVIGLAIYSLVRG